jgi:hypothetical protein
MDKASWITAVSAFSASRRGSRKPEEAGKIRSLAQLGNAQFHRAGPRLPVPIPVAVALNQPIDAPLAISGSGPLAHLQLH